MQFFKGDATEQKFYNAGEPVLSALSLSKDEFFDEAYACFVLGELLYDTGRAPLARAIDRQIFRESFSALFDSFLVAGTFEAYLDVFRQIFGAEVDVQFTVPGPGKLQISITADDVEEFEFVARQVESNAYVFYEIIDDEDDNIVFQTVKGIESEYELEQMLFEMVPAGIYTEITLSFGGA